MKAQEAFDILARNYLEEPQTNDGRWTGEALLEINRKRFETLLIDQIRSPTPNKERKDIFLRALLPIASLECVNTLFPLLSDSDFSDLAAWILSNLSVRPEVSERAKKLTMSTNPVEKAGAITVLSDYYMSHPGELVSFESSSETPVEVRRVVAGLYSISKSRNALIKYANDKDVEVRFSVFAFFMRQNNYCGTYLYGSSLREAGECELAIEGKEDADWSLVMKFPSEVAIISNRSVKKAKLVRRGEDEYGLLLELLPTVIGPLEKILLIPREGIGEEPQRVLSMLNLTNSVLETNLSDSDIATIASLWSSVDVVDKEKQIR